MTAKIGEPRRVLLPTDFSEPASAALPYAAGIARAFGAELHLLHAVVLHDDYGEGRFPEYREVVDSLHTRVDDLLAALSETASAEGVTVERAERRGVAPAPVILDYVEEEGIDVIVMATHGRRGVRRLLLGSVAEEVVRHSPVPVITVRGRDRFPGDDGQVSILVAASLTETSAPLVDYAAALSGWTGASVSLLHAIEILRPKVVYEELPELPQFSWKRLESEARDRLDELMRRSGLDPGRTTIEVVRESPAAAILGRCEGDGAPDLIVVGHRQRSGIDNLFLGSVAERIVSRCRVPVLTVPVPLVETGD
ncbi:MAG TPA: universal stress protein [Thermoanaerobaculia bacterium]|nr:universal stress protein [Thermoanaerobaculia bacterium]